MFTGALSQSCLMSCLTPLLWLHPDGFCKILTFTSVENVYKNYMLWCCDFRKQKSLNTVHTLTWGWLCVFSSVPCFDVVQECVFGLHREWKQCHLGNWATKNRRFTTAYEHKPHLPWTNPSWHYAKTLLSAVRATQSFSLVLSSDNQNLSILGGRQVMDYSFEFWLQSQSTFMAVNAESLCGSSITVIHPDLQYYFLTAHLIRVWNRKHYSVRGLGSLIVE